MKIDFKRGFLIIIITFVILFLLESYAFASDLEDEHYVAYKYYAVLHRDIEALRHIVNAESRGEGIYGMELVVEIILNRVESDKFPNTIYDVIYQENAFDGINYEAPITEDSIVAINNVFEVGVQHNDIFFFQEKNLTHSWADRNAVEKFTYNNHKFYALKESRHE